MIGIRERRHGSWLDKNSAAMLGTKFGYQLWERCRGQKGIFLTLTYDRSLYAGALDLYRTQRERQHVAMFMRRLSKATGQSLVGKWVRKLEFQQGGWVHWHLVIVGVGYIPNSVIEKCWGHGFTKTKGLNKQRALYLTKYVSKAGCDLPAFIWGERPGSVKVVSVSPGFWGAPVKPSSYCPVYAKWGPIKPSRFAGYVPIGVRMERNRGCTVARGGPGQRPHAVRSVCCEPAEFISLVSHNASACIRDRGWLWFDVEERCVEAAAAACRRAAGPSEVGCEPPPRSGGLNLRGTRKPDFSHLPSWLQTWWEQQAMSDPAYN